MGAKMSKEKFTDVFAVFGAVIFGLVIWKMIKHGKDSAQEVKDTEQLVRRMRRMRSRR
jgi:hypothetical protein